MHERLNRGLTLGLLGNILFIAFGLITYTYLQTYSENSVFSRIMEAAAYICEFSAFFTLIYAEYCLASSIRMRKLLKIGFAVYVVLEAIMMTFELNEYRLSFYKPYSLPLAIIHAIISAAVCFAFLELDPNNSKFELTVIVCVGIILGGMLGNFFGVRVYFSILVNAFGFALLFWWIKRLIRNEDIEIDCHGDRARVAEFTSSTLFTDGIGSEKKKNKKDSDKE